MPVGFFDEFPTPPRPPTPGPRARQPWEGRPEGVIGGWGAVACRAGPDRYRLRGAEEHRGLPLRPVVRSGHLLPKGAAGPRGAPDAEDARPDGPRIGVLFADGRKAASGAGPMAAPALGGGDPEQPVLRPGGGGGSLGQWHMNLWLCPLPPPGPLTWVETWPAMGADEVAVEVDASVLESAAQAAEVLWDPDPERHRGYSRTTLRGPVARPPEAPEPPASPA